ncbi:MAG: glycosyltransferase family 4 protein [Myxococcota bacterium]
MKILMVARRFPPDILSGAETIFANLYRQARHRHEVRLVVGWRRAREQVPAEAIAVSLKGRRKLAGWTAMARVITQEVRQWRPDVVLSNDLELPLLRAPTAAILHDLSLDARTMAERVRQAAALRRARAMNAVLTVSSRTARDLAAAGIPEARIRVVPNGVDIEAFTPPPRTDREIIQIAYPSRILPGKGQHLAIDAVARLPRMIKRRVNLTIVGAVIDPVYLDQLRVQAYNQPVRFSLDVPDMAPYYQDADIVLYPSLMREVFAFTAIEAMACGRPVVWFDQPSVREAVAGLGVPVPREDVAAMRAAIIRLIENPEEREQIGRDGRRYAEGNLSWQKAWRQYENILQSIAR